MIIFFVLTLLIDGLCGDSSGSRMVCSHIPGLTGRQREMCKASPETMAAVGQGYRLAIAECQRRFSRHRWNCTPVTSKSSFGHVVIVGSREAAFTYGIVSAGVAYSVMSSCARGNISTCGCYTDGQPRKGGWKWGGCSVDLSYGLAVSRRFLHSRELDRDARTSMNLHNYRAGRIAVRSKMTKVCKCHGVSGSCTMRSCWRSLPRLAQIGEALMTRYWKARAVYPASSGGLRTRRGRVTPRRADLVYLKPSPNYCEPDPAVGTLGTAGRACNRSISGLGSCDVLCCGRGYITQEVIKSSHCNCKFRWCCQVDCETCTQRSQIYTCN